MVIMSDERKFLSIPLVVGLLVFLAAFDPQNKAQAASSSATQHGQPAASFTWNPATQRVLHFGHYRNWDTQDGQLLVCPYQLTPRECSVREHKQWIPLASWPMPSGFKIESVQYVFAGRDGERNLLVLLTRTP
jgi:hypothetical protein